MTHAHLGWCVRERIPYLILPVKQSSSEPSPRTGPPGQPPGQSRTIRRSDTGKPPGKPPGPSRAEAIRASRRASHRARLKPNRPPKRYERAARQAAGPVWSRSDIRMPSGTPLGIHQPTAVATRCARTLPSARASGRFHYRTEPLRLFHCESLNGGRS